MIVGYFALSARILLLGSERIFLKKLEKFDSVVVSTIFFLLAGILLAPVLFFIPKSAYFISSHFMLLALLSSLSYSLGFFAYVKALSVGDASLVAPLYNSSILWLMFLGYLFLEDHITIFRVVGAIGMFIGVFLLHEGNLWTKLQTVKSSKASLFMILGSFFIAIGRTLDTLIIQEVNEILYAWLTNFLIGFFLLLVVVYRRNGWIIKELLNSKPKVIFAASLTNGWSYLFLLIAIINLEVTVAEPLSLLSTFVTAYLAKKFLHERVKERIPGMILMVIGAGMIMAL